MKKALIAGASGFTGNKLMHLLLKDGAYSTVYALVRKYVDVEHPKLVQILVEYESLTAEELPDGIDDAFCCLGTTIRKAQTRENFRKVDFEYITRFAKLCEQKKVSALHLISSIGASPHSVFYYQKVKGEVECFVTSLDISTVVIYRPSVIYGGREEFRLGEGLSAWVSRVFEFAFVGKLRRIKAITGDQLAGAICMFSRNSRPGRWILESEEIVDLFKNA